MSMHDRRHVAELTLEADCLERSGIVRPADPLGAAGAAATLSSRRSDAGKPNCGLHGVTPVRPIDHGWSVGRGPARLSLMQRGDEPSAGLPIHVTRRGSDAGLWAISPAGDRRPRIRMAARTLAPLSRTAAPGISLRLALMVSGLLHLATLVMLLPAPGGRVPLAPELPQRQVEMVFIQQPATTRGAPPRSVQASPQPQPTTTAAALPLPPQSASAQPSAASAAPESPVGATSPHWQTSMLDDIGNAPADDPGYSDTSDDIRPTRPDSAYRNMPPHYPADAARHGQRGTVDVIVHVKPDGRAGQVEVTSSSGVASLDHAAVEALAKWHFQPQMSGSVPVPSQFRIAVHYDGSGS